jgi:cytochrome c553
MEETMKHFVPVLMLACLPSLAFAADRPDWAYPPAQQANVPAEPDDGKPLQAPGSTRSYTRAQIDSQTDSPDWFPNEHPQMPSIVARGNGSTVRACIGCHLPHGLGHPENSRLSGTTAAYFLRQLADFKSGARKGEGAGAMIRFVKDLSDDQVHAAADYFSSLKPQRWTRVVEAETVPKTYFKGTRRLPLTGAAAGTEPIGKRIVEVPENEDSSENLRDPRAGFIAYVPPGSLNSGRSLVAQGTTAGGGSVTACTVCHGPTLKGLGPVPPLAGRSPSYIARQLYDMKLGNRHGAWTALMRPVVAGLTDRDILNASAYLASLQP